MADHLDLERQIRFVNMLVCGDRTVTAGAYPVRYRQTPAVFANGNEGANWQEIPRLMSQLCKSPLFWDREIEEFCIEFLRIHPFVDGNGRTASILLNRRTWKQDFISVPTVDGWIEDARV